MQMKFAAARSARPAGQVRALGGLRLASIASALCLCLALAPVTVALAADPAPIPFNIPAQPMVSALQAFSAKTGIAVGGDTQQLRTRTSQPVVGTYAPEKALQLLLQGSGLQVERISETVFRVNGPEHASQLVPVPQLAPVPASAPRLQTPQPPPEELLVTANKRIERLQDVPSSVTALRADRLAEIGLVKIEDYAARVPGLIVNNLTAGGAQNTVALRGVTTGPVGSPTVGIFVDDTPLTASTALSGGTGVPDLDPADLDRIEVLRGPQGTLYGGGSMGGLIKFVTKAPDYDHVSARLQLDGSSIAGGGYGGGVRAAMNAPITDTIAIRASAFARHDGGFIDNLSTGQNDVNRGLYDGGRVSLGAKLGENFNIRLSAMRQQIRARGNPVIDIDGTTLQPLYGDLQTRRAPGSDNSHNVNTVYDARLTGDLGFADVVSTTSWGENRFQSNFDYSPVLAPLVAGLFGVNNAGVAVGSDRRTNKFTEETRLSSKPGQTFSWQIGGYFTHESTSYGQSVRVFDGRTGAPLPVVLPPLGSIGAPAKFEEKAVFGNVNYAVTERFDVTVGLRYSSNDQNATQYTSGALFGNSNAPLTSSDSSTTFLVNPRFKITDDVMVYGRIASGYRPGGPNVVVAGVPAAFGADTVVNYEAGVKADFFDKTLSFDAAAFYIDWSDIQVRQQSPVATTYYVNGGQAHSKGVEGSVTWRPVAALSIAGNLSFIDAELDGDLPQGVAKKGDRLPDTPRWSGQVSADYTFPVIYDWSGSVGGSYRHVGERIAALELNPYHMPAYDTVDLRASVQNDRYLVTLFVRNVGDERGYLSAFRFGTLQQVAIIQPRTVGVSVAVNF